MKAFTPMEVTVVREERVVLVRWGDEHDSRYSFAYLRSVCPCAHCDSAKHGGTPSPIDPGLFDGIALNGVSEVGRYALRFDWSDGHDLGIFSYAYLRSRCPCGICENEFDETP